MKKVTILFFFLFLFFCSDVSALELNTKSIIVRDMNSGRIFYEKNKNEKRLIASTTKVATAITAIENGRLEELVEAGDEVLKMYGSNIYIEKNEKMLLLDLIYGLMMRSGNDASVVIANHVGGSEEKFVSMMNTLANTLGMKDTVYSNPHGLDDDTKNYSTAEDLSLMYSYAWKNKIFRQIAGTKKYETKSDKKSYLWFNRTKILEMYDKATGGKTGYTPDAGRVLVSSASNGDLELVAASFNSIYDYDLHIKLYEEVFRSYKNYTLLDKKSFQLDKFGEDEKAYIKNSIVYPLTEKERNSITTKIEISKDKNLHDGDEVGTVYAYLDNDVIAHEKIYVEVSNKGFFAKIKMFFQNSIKKFLD